MERAIVHMDMHDYYIACERLANSSLKGVPLIIGGGTNRGTVAACSKEAARFGVRVSMPTAYAQRLCPNATILKGDYGSYTNKSKELTEIIKEHAPVVEKSSIHSFYLDITGMDRFFGCYDWTKELSLQISKMSGLDPSWALSVNKTVSKIGVVGTTPTMPRILKQEEVQNFLNPLPIQRLPNIGDTTFQLLSRIGIRQIGKVSEMPPVVLQKMLGKRGNLIWQHANGIDSEPVKPYSEKRAVYREHDFDMDCIDIQVIKAQLMAMVEQLAFKLRQDNLVTAKVIVKVKYNNLDTETKQSKIGYTSLDHILKKEVQLLFFKLYHRRMRLVKVGVRFSDIVSGSHQINLFEDTSEILSLYNALDSIRNKYGMNAVGTSSAFQNYRTK
ncbi:DNA polymerase IV [Arenibacter sp. BSSL-BM3]|uniref:DNA polymerase IV n=1 Tax=Arenibacter arenosicollis TaxID=2762274 RepID=A0ABR7QRP9_9FLAO|nr:DNA polymerase IV [Arenibacter arenosicollis]MBC8769852.1 DNA polymerase IV [Arenibacter arenosicollis]